MKNTREKDYTPSRSFSEMTVRVSKNFGDKTLFRYFGENKEIHEMKYKQFCESVLAFRAGLETLSLSGKRIAVVGENCPEWLIAYLAVVSGGSVVIPLDKELSIHELFGFLKLSGAEAIVFTESFCAKFKEKILSDEAHLRYIPIACKDEEILACDSVTPFYDILSAGKQEKPYFEPQLLSADASEEMRVMLFTSGTTGTSKCVMLSEKNVVSNMNSAAESVDFYSDDTLVSVLPLHHTYELTCSLAAVNLGATICINDSLKYVLRNFKLFKPTGLVLVPLFVDTMYKKIKDEIKKKNMTKQMNVIVNISEGVRKVGIDLRKPFFSQIRSAFGGRLEKIVCGGAPLKDALCTEFEKMGIALYEGYGITECSPLISVNPYRAPKVGSVGPTVNCCVAKIDGDEHNDKGYLEGEILVKGTNVMLGYFENPEANAEAFTEDGYFRTGDIGYMDEDGYLYITGRKKNVIVLENGKNVFPEEMEEYLSYIDSVAESVVVGRKRDDGSIALTAVIYPAFDQFDKGASTDDIAARIKADVTALNKTLPSFKQIRDIELRRTEFEKTPSRKIKRYLIK